MAGYYEVQSWHVATTFNIASAEPGELPPVSIEISALDQSTDVNHLARSTYRVRIVESKDDFLGQLQSASGFEAELIFLFHSPETAINAFFDAAMTDRFASQVVQVFMDEARVPVFGSAPQEWMKLSDLLVKSRSPEAAVAVVGAGVLHMPVLTLVLAIGGTTIAIRVMNEVGTGLASVVRRLFERLG
jgi:hypothetical protein